MFYIRNTMMVSMLFI